MDAPLPPLPTVPTVNPEFVKVYEAGFKLQTPARVQGFELELQAAPVGDWFIEAGIGYLDDQYLELPDGVIGRIRPSASSVFPSGH